MLIDDAESKIEFMTGRNRSWIIFGLQVRTSNFFYSNFFYNNFTIYGKSTNNSKSNGEINSPDVPSRIGPIKN